MDSMNTVKHKTVLDSALQNYLYFKDQITQTYLELKRRNAEAQYDAAGISAGKFCEVLVRLLQHEVFGTYIKFGALIGNMADECRKLVTSTKSSAVESHKSNYSKNTNLSTQFETREELVILEVMLTRIKLIYLQWWWRPTG